MQYLAGVDNTTTAPSIVVKQIRECILDGLYKPGDRLPEAELAAKFNLSRSPGRLENKRIEQSAKQIVTGILKICQRDTCQGLQMSHPLL